MESGQQRSLSKPYIIGYMSTDEARHYHHDLSQLKFVSKIPKGKLSYDLNLNINSAIKRTTDDNDEKINLLLQFILDQKERLNLQCIKQEPMFITYRRTLITLMCSSFNRDSWRIIATLLNGNIYLCSLDTQQDLDKKLSRSHKEQIFCAWGYKFEQYLLSEKPQLQPDIQKPVVENEEFSLYYYAVLGKHELLYGAQIDGLLATHPSVQDPPASQEVEVILDYLRKNRYVELKTNREIDNVRQERNFKKFKLLRCWCQCYLAGLEGLLIGFRTDEGVVQRLQWFNTEDIPAYCKNEWEPAAAVAYLESFLSYIKSCFKRNLVNTYKNYDINNIGPVSLVFERLVNGEIRVLSCESDHNDPILPDWFVNSMAK